MRERRQCVCRGWIEAEPGNLNDIQAAVQAHQATPEHQPEQVVTRLQRANPRIPSPAEHQLRRELEHQARPIDVLQELGLAERRVAVAGR